MQDSWCGDDMPLTGSRQTSWEEEEDVEIGMWNSSSSQEANTSLNWPPYMKKMPTKVIVTCGDLTSHTGASWQWKGKKKSYEAPENYSFLLCETVPSEGCVRVFALLLFLKTKNRLLRWVEYR